VSRFTLATDRVESEGTLMRSDLFAPSHQETEATKLGMVLQNSKMLKIALDGEVPSEELPESTVSGSDESGGGGLLGGLMGR
jgi:hypothetical protein